VKRAISAGDIVETRCTKCRVIMNHTIVAMVGEQIVKVECNTCHSVHKYHATKEAKEQKSPSVTRTARTPSASPRRERRDPAAEAAAEWESLLAGVDPERALPYDMNGVYRVKSLVAHPTFGLGVVMQLIQPNKMELLFRDGRKRLRCG